MRHIRLSQSDYRAGLSIIRRKLKLAALAAAALLWGLTQSGVAAEANENWPQWRGPLATGVAPAAQPLVKWSETENIKWKVKIPGRGSATPIIWEDRVFIQTAIPTGTKPEVAAEPAPAEPAVPAEESPGRRRGGFRSEKPTEVYQFVLLCLDRDSGKVLWQQVVREELPHEGHHKDHGFSSHSPVTDGQHVYAYFGSRGLHCYDLDGNRQWSKDLGRMETKNDFGEGSSPALHGDKIVINWDHEGDDFIAAFDKRTGEELWRQPRDEDTSWSTPLVVEHGGQTQVVVAATNRIRSYDLQTGQSIWECGGMTDNTIPTPVAGDGVIYVTSGFRGNALLAIKLGHTGDLTDTEAIAWSHDKNTPYVPSPLLYDHRLYFFGGNSGRLSCFDINSGTALYSAERIEGLQGVYASPVAADGRVYLVGRDGTSVVIKHGDTPEVLSTNKLDDNIDASPALVGNQLFLRGHEYLYCIGKE